MTCEMCGTTVPPGEQFDAGSDYTLCADRVECTERMLEQAKTRTLGEAPAEPVTEDAAQ
jgi:hypothetical protein